MTDDDNPSISSFIPPPMDHGFAFSCELGMLNRLLDADGLNAAGLRAAYDYIRLPSSVDAASVGALLEARQIAETRLAHGLAAANGVPVSHYLRPLPGTPDDIGDLA